MPPTSNGILTMPLMASDGIQETEVIDDSTRMGCLLLRGSFPACYDPTHAGNRAQGGHPESSPGGATPRGRVAASLDLSPRARPNGPCAGRANLRLLGG